MSAYIRKTGIYHLLAFVFGIFSVFLYLSVLSPANAGAATRADCNARANTSDCINQVNSQCSGKSGSERTRCIENVLRQYTVTAVGSGTIKDCSFEESKKAEEDAKNNGTTNRCLGNLPKAHDADGQIRRALSIVFGVAAGVALIALLVAAFNYATAGTDIEKTSRSKRSIITALAGLVIAVAAQAIVLTVLGQL